MFGHSSMVRILLNRGADVSRACGGDETTLHAPQVGPASVVEMLVKAGADRDISPTGPEQSAAIVTKL